MQNCGIFFPTATSTLTSTVIIILKPILKDHTFLDDFFLFVLFLPIIVIYFGGLFRIFSGRPKRAKNGKRAEQNDEQRSQAFFLLFPFLALGFRISIFSLSRGIDILMMIIVGSSACSFGVVRGLLQSFFGSSV